MEFTNDDPEEKFDKKENFLEAVQDYKKGIFFKVYFQNPLYKYLLLL